MNLPEVATPEQWNAAREELLEKEKILTRKLDALAAERRCLPMMELTTQYQFNTPTGRCSLHELFDGRDQLIVYHHMLKPNDESPCAGCSMVGDSIGHLTHLHARNTSFVMVARAPVQEIGAFRNRMQWTFPFVETTDSFNVDMGVNSGFGLSVFLRREDDIFKTYFTNGRGVETIGSTWTLLDLTARGRQEVWEDSPDGWPQSKPYQWWRLHDEYA